MAEPKHRVGVERAARVAGVSRWTIHRRIKTGVLSCSRDKRGNPLIDLADLARVFDLEPAEVAATLAELRSKQRGAATPLQSTLQAARGQHGAGEAPGAERAVQVAADRLEAELRRERDRVAALEAELRAARADAAAWADRYVRLAERALLTDQRPDRPAPDPIPQATPTPSTPPPDPADPPRRDADPRPKRDPEGIIEGAARAILGDALPNVVFGRRRR